MNRRVFLGSVGSIASLGTLAYATRDSLETLAVRIWLSEQAASYEGVIDRIFDYLENVLGFDHWTLELSVGGTVSVSTENAARLTTRGEWPMAVAAGELGQRNLEPVSDVNLLVTDGGMEEAPTGYGIPHIASVGGARQIAALEPFDELVDDDWVVPNTTPARTIQVLAHEIGHALGLEHDHGVAFRDGGAVIATPMLSSYAWDPTYDTDRSRCGTIRPSTDGLERKLSLAFSSCARRELE
ncbi:peptidase M10A and M12B matrixin and adamalysin [Natrinema longum]|uniref:Peptidase M10A and M12B matrixin and adamalysin n=1 Tax=Natrinema longum TaxID=370324 RepID=A0A8A2U7F4_9EURY|nr:peptidase M10A and M12B matrixin and adamalysin [Natrinema longum]MBZ6494024.1 peptidase M10A and M12B matrixin and adamalysin [Natrinema longum]QSW84641.1 peptidase M10A and M12B matrixin and adamalysin [Natrinema longum]